MCNEQLKANKDFRKYHFTNVLYINLKTGVLNYIDFDKHYLSHNQDTVVGVPCRMTLK